LSLALGDGAEPGAIRDRDQNARTVPSDTVIGLTRTTSLAIAASMLKPLSEIAALGAVVHAYAVAVIVAELAAVRRILPFP
jgi:hypothetical protein